MYLLDTNIFLEILLQRENSKKEVSNQFKLDFDDSYQYAVAQKFDLRIMSFDSDFDRTEKGRMIPELKQDSS